MGFVVFYLLTLSLGLMLFTHYIPVVPTTGPLNRFKFFPYKYVCSQARRFAMDVLQIFEHPFAHAIG